MECPLTLAYIDEVAETIKDQGMVAFGIVKQGRDSGLVPAVAIDRTRSAGFLAEFLIVFGTQERVDIDGWNTFEGQKNRMGTEETRGLIFILAINGALEGIIQRDVNFVGFVPPSMLLRMEISPPNSRILSMST